MFRLFKKAIPVVIDGWKVEVIERSDKDHEEVDLQQMLIDRNNQLLKAAGYDTFEEEGH